METIIYIRVAKDKGKIKIKGSEKPTSAPLEKMGYPKSIPLPTVSFALKLNIPDEAFKRAETIIAELTLPQDNLEIAALLPDTPVAGGEKSI